MTVCCPWLNKDGCLLVLWSGKSKDDTCWATRRGGAVGPGRSEANNTNGPNEAGQGNASQTTHAQVQVGGGTALSLHCLDCCCSSSSSI